MFTNLLKKMFGTQNERVLERIGPIVARVNALEPQISALPDDRLAARTAEFRQRVGNGEPLEALLPEVFATVRWWEVPASTRGRSPRCGRARGRRSSPPSPSSSTP